MQNINSPKMRSINLPLFMQLLKKLMAVSHTNLKTDITTLLIMPILLCIPS